MTRIAPPLRRATALAAPALLGLALAGCQSAEPSVVEGRPPAVSVARPLARPVVEYDPYTGRTRSVATVDIRARVQGYLKEIRFEAGDLVEAGQVLFVIDPREYEDAVALAEAKLEQARARSRLTAVERERYRSLAQRDVGSRQDFDRAAAAYDVSVAEAKAAEAELDRARLDLDFTQVRSPIAGQAGSHLIDVGNLITVGQTEANLLTTVVAVQPMFVDFDVDERALLRYRKAASDRRGEEVEPTKIRDARIPVEMGLADEAGYPYVGLLDFADNRVDPATGTLRARGVFANADRLLTPGLFARVRIPSGDPSPSLLIAETAIGSDQGIRFAYVLGEGDRAERRPIAVGATVSGLAVVTEGLSPDDRVVVSGIQRIREGAAVTPQEVPMPMPPGAEEALTSIAAETDPADLPDLPPAEGAAEAAGMDHPPVPPPAPEPDAAPGAESGPEPGADPAPPAADAATATPNAGR